MDQIEKPHLSASAKIILWCTIILVVFLSFSMFFMWKYAKDLSQSPFVLGAKKTAEANNAEDVSCSCMVIGAPYKPGFNPSFSFNSQGISDATNQFDFSDFKGGVGDGGS